MTSRANRNFLENDKLFEEKLAENDYAGTIFVPGASLAYSEI